jgi:beta-mannosidase
VESGEGTVSWEFEEGEVELWWPSGHGKQPLYTVKVELHGSVSVGRRHHVQRGNLHPRL